MRRCFDLAVNGLGLTSPNPLVGSIVVHKDRIIGEGFHTGYGNAHAEVEALRSVKESDKHLLSESALYVNLEPCSHHGKTPPCSDLILQSGIKTVVVGALDPNPVVNGNGVRMLRNAGVTVIEDVMRDECIQLNKRFYTYHQLKRPYVILKWAQSQDGFIATKPLKRMHLSNQLSQMLTHKWRAEESAILIGFNTASIDDPELTVRNWNGKNPLRLVYDPELELDKSLKIFNDESATWVLNNVKESDEENVFYKKITSENWVNETLELLYQNQILSVIVEGGTKTLETFIHQGVWDEARIISTPHTLKDGLKAPLLLSSNTSASEQIQDNLLTIYLR